MTDRHPITLADSRCSLGLGHTWAPPPASLRPPQGSCLGLATREAEGLGGWLYVQETRIFTMLYF